MKSFMIWAGAWGTMGDRKGIYMVLVGRPNGRPRHRWEGNIKMDFQDMGWGGWIALAQDRQRWRALVNALMNLQVP
jgi:hypothetical protein